MSKRDQKRQDRKNKAITLRIVAEAMDLAERHRLWAEIRAIARSRPRKRKPRRFRSIIAPRGMSHNEIYQHKCKAVLLDYCPEHSGYIASLSPKECFQILHPGE
jgi:hypothetical protein